MNYGIITYGSRGDVQPYASLALGLMERGHQVYLAAPENFKDFVEGFGINFYPLHGNVEELLYSAEGIRVLKTGNAFTLLRYLQKGGHKMQQKIGEDMFEFAALVDVLIANVLTNVGVYTIAEKLNKKWATVQLSLPTTPTKEFPFAGFAFFNTPSYNFLTHKLIRFLYWQLNKKDANKFRVSIGLPISKKSILDKISKENALNLYAFSPQLIAKPKDWKSNCDITGYLTLPEKNREANEIDKIPDGFEEWLNRGKKPVYMGFGSMPVPDAELFGNILKEILLKTGERIVFCKGWSVIENLPQHENLFVLKSINHEWLFPKCKAAMIHGGAGTTAAVLKAKIPAIIVSVFGDQPWWGKLIEGKKLGVHIPFKKLTSQKLLRAIEMTETSLIQKNILEIATKINNEDGLKIAIDKLEEYFSE